MASILDALGINGNNQEGRGRFTLVRLSRECAGRTLYSSCQQLASYLIVQRKRGDCLSIRHRRCRSDRHSYRTVRCDGKRSTQRIGITAGISVVFKRKGVIAAQLILGVINPLKLVPCSQTPAESVTATANGSLCRPLADPGFSAN